jgi:CPA2 family monovalent cation:H+ antiporter-2
MPTLDTALIYLLFAVIGVVGCRLLHLPAMLGYLGAGIFLAQGGAMVEANEVAVASVAEIGVVLLMFVIGLEFNLPKLMGMRRMVFGFGMAQVVLMLAGTLIGHFLIANILASFNLPWDLNWQGAVVLGAALAMSSTAIVVKMMAERAELDSQHGRRVIGALLFQDLAVVPLLVLIPALGRMNEGNVWAELSLALLKAAVLVGLLLWGGQKAMRVWLRIVDRRNSEELFMLNILLITLGLAWLTEHAGLSMAMGSFMAGMLIAETDYKHRVEEDIRPFHDVFLGLFFITLGMKLDWHVLQEQWPWVLVLTLIPVLVKAVLIAVLAYTGGASNGVAARTGIYLAQAGEFGFVLLTLGLAQGLIDPRWSNPVLAAMVLSMLATPFLIQHADRWVFRFSPDDWLSQSLQITTIASHAIAIDKHVLVCGFGHTGRNLCQLLAQQKISYIALDVNPEVVKTAVLDGHHVEVGDSFQLSNLVSAGLNRASAVVVSFDDTVTALGVISLVHKHAPSVPVLVRTRDEHDMVLLKQAGAHEVIPDAFEVSLSLATHTMSLLGVEEEKINQLVFIQRHTQYAGLKETAILGSEKP